MLALKYHPDRETGDPAKFREVNWAFQQAQALASSPQQKFDPIRPNKSQAEILRDFMQNDLGRSAFIQREMEALDHQMKQEVYFKGGRQILRQTSTHEQGGQKWTKIQEEVLN